jgi:hypothetical protein
MKNLHRILFAVSLLLIVASWATCHYGVEHEIGKIPPETRAGMSDFDWIGREWIGRGMIILFVAVVLDCVALMMWLRGRRRIANQTSKFRGRAHNKAMQPTAPYILLK